MKKIAVLLLMPFLAGCEETGDMTMETDMSEANI
jgi:hypothetical protein